MSTTPPPGYAASEHPEQREEDSAPRGRFSITIGPFTFPTKSAAKEYTSNLLRTLPLGEVENKHVHFLVALLNRHPRAHQKIGVGLLGFEVREHETYGGHCFWLIRRDGTETDFSYRECLSPSTNKASVTAAFRQEIQYQCFRFKEETYRHGMVCEITGEPLDYDEIDVDHAPLYLLSRSGHRIVTRGSRE